MKRSLFLLACCAGLLLFSCVRTGFAQDSSVWSQKKTGWQLIAPTQRTEVFNFADQYKDYLRQAKNTGLAIRESINQARAQGFVEFKEPSQIKPGARLIFNNRDRAAIFAIIGSEPLTNGSRVIGTHHDSPHIGLKGRPFYLSQNFLLFKTIYYGGLKKYQWANLPLALVGRIDTIDNRTVDISIGLNPGDPVFVIPDVAPHSDSELRQRTYNNVLGGEELNPVIGSVNSDKTTVVGEVLKFLTATYNIKEEDFVSAELALVPAMPPADVGFDRGLVGSYGQDDRLSTYCSLRALLDTKETPRYTAMAYLTNFEEVGSTNNTGASSRFLTTTFVEMLTGQRGAAYRELDLRTALRNAQVISADTNDGVNPIFPGTSETSNAARLSYGVTIKLYGGAANAPSEFTARIRALLDQHSIPWQTHTQKVDTGTGGTIARFFSAEEMQVIDMGVPLLSMHSPFEMSSKVDVWNFYRFMRVFYNN